MDFHFNPAARYLILPGGEHNPSYEGLKKYLDYEVNAVGDVHSSENEFGENHSIERAQEEALQDLAAYLTGCLPVTVTALYGRDDEDIIRCEIKFAPVTLGEDECGKVVTCDMLGDFPFHWLEQLVE